MGVNDGKPPLGEQYSAWKSRTDCRQVWEIETQARHAVYGREMRTYCKSGRYK